MNITEEQKEILKKYDIELLDDEDELLDVIDDKIISIGFYADYSLNKEGRELQRLYDQLYNQFEDEYEKMKKARK